MNVFPNNVMCEDKNETKPCFNVLTEEETKLIEENTTSVHFNKGEIIAKQGTKANNILFISEGLLKVGMKNGENHLILSIKPPNHFIALEALYGSDYNPYSITAIEDSMIHFIDLDVFKEVCNKNYRFTNAILEVINSSAVTIYNRMFSLTQKQLHGRLADILLCLSTRIFKSNHFDLPLSRKDLAALTGMAPESVIRILKEFKTDKLLNTKGKHIEILNPEMLKKISDVG